MLRCLCICMCVCVCVWREDVGVGDGWRWGGRALGRKLFTAFTSFPAFTIKMSAKLSCDQFTATPLFCLSHCRCIILNSIFKIFLFHLKSSIFTLYVENSIIFTL